MEVLELNIKNKQGKWFLQKVEDRFKRWLLPGVPLWLETYHLTFLTLAWSALVILLFWLGLSSYFYLWFLPVIIVLQYLTDLLDGAVGRERDTGLVKWGYYSDHFLDFIFLTSIFIGYGLWIGFSVWFFLFYAVMSGLMVSSFLMVGAGETMSISFLKIGPTEGRLIFIIFHLIMVAIGLNYFDLILPIITILGVISMIIVFVKSQSILWKEDMINKNKNL